MVSTIHKALLDRLRENSWVYVELPAMCERVDPATIDEHIRGYSEHDPRRGVRRASMPTTVNGAASDVVRIAMRRDGFDTLGTRHE